MRKLVMVWLLPLVVAKTANADLTPVLVSPPPEPLLTPGTRSSFGAGNADLGIVWNDGVGPLQVAFGDTSQVAGNGGGPGPGGITTGTLGSLIAGAPEDGMGIQSMVSGPNGQAEGIIAGCPVYSPPGFPHCIPTAAATIDGIDFMHFMIVESQTCTGGGYQTYGSGFAWREAGANTPFSIVPASDLSNIQMGPTSNFGQVALLTGGDYLYMFGTPPGRAGAVQLARANGSIAAYYGVWQFWNGSTWDSSQSNAAYIVPALEPDASRNEGGQPTFGSVAELSVQFDPAVGRYVMTYLNLSRNAGDNANGATGAIVLRDAANLAGPWTQEKEILNQAGVPGLYGGYMAPPTYNGAIGSASSDQIFFDVSEWGPYDVYPYSMFVETRSVPDDLVTDGGFEEQLSGIAPIPCLDRAVDAVYPPWVSDGDPAIGFDSCLGNAAPGGGSNNAWINAADTSSTWHELHQSIAVAPNTNYVMTVSLDSYNVYEGYAGAETRGAPLAANGRDMCSGVTEGASGPGAIAGTSFSGTSNGYEVVSFAFDSGANSLVDIYLGIQSRGGNIDSWVRFDEVSVVPSEHVNDGSFELQSSDAVSWPYETEGTGAKGIDIGNGLAHTGVSDGWVNTTNSAEWNAFTQIVGVTPGQRYTLRGWVQTSTTFGEGYFGVRNANGTILSQTGPFGASSPYEELVVSFTPTTSTVKIFAGYWTPSGGIDSWMRVDDLSVQ